MIRAALIGCGGIGRVHYAALQQLPGAEWVALCDLHPDRARAFSPDLPVYPDAETLLRETRPDVVHLCTPHPSHVSLAQLALRYGAHVLTEKPPAISPASWQTLLDAARGSDRQVGVCFQNRYNTATRFVRDGLRSGAWGPLLGARAFVTWQRERAYYTESGWRGKLATEGGGVLLNQAVHTLDLLVWLMGGYQSAEAGFATHHLKDALEVEDTAEIRLTFTGERHALLYATTAYCENSAVLIEFKCERAVIRMEDTEVTVRCADGATEHNFCKMPESPGKAYWGGGHVACLRDFYHSVQTGEPFLTRISAVQPTMAALFDCYRSGRGTTFPD